MALHSDISVDSLKFRAEGGSNEIKKFNEDLMDVMKKGPEWFEVNMKLFPSDTALLTSR